MSVTLLVNGMLYEGWTSVEVSRSIKEMAGQFTLHVSERWTGGANGPASPMSYQIRPGDKCVVAYMGRPVITGYVDAYNPKYDKGSHDVTIQGRSKTGDLCDCTAEQDVKGGEMKKVTLEQAARKLAGKYGIGVINQATQETFDVMRVHPGETNHEFLERYARPGAVALTDDEKGNLRLVHVSPGGGGVALIEGVNILSAAAMLRADKRHSKYASKGQDRGKDGEFGKPVAQRKATVSDGGVKRYRPFTLLNETKTTKRNARQRLAWEAAQRAGESVKAEVKVVGWLNAEMGGQLGAGKLWMPGDKVMLVSPMLAVNRVLAVQAVKHKLDKSGTKTHLSLVPPEALNPKGGGKGGGGGPKTANDNGWFHVKPEGAPQDG